MNSIRISRGAVTSAGWCAALALLATMPVRALPAQVTELPPPTGPASIGFRSFHWVDSSRAEPMTTRLDDRREVAAFLWYPAAPTRESRRAMYVPDTSLMPSNFRQRFPTIVSLRQHGFANAPIDTRAGPLPVLLFSPGGGMSVTHYLTVIEDLVSHGFVVLGVEDSFDYPVRLSDGRVATVPEFTFADVLSLNRNRADARALDMLFALRQLERLNAGPPRSDLRGRLDLTRVGAFGHSRGGLAAAEACKREPRLRGCLNYDGHYLNGGAYADTVAGVLSQPFLQFRRFRPEPTDSMLKEWKMSPEDWATNRDTLERRARRVVSSAVTSSYLITIDGAVHLSFSDRPFLWTVPVGVAPRARPQMELLNAIREYTREFFDVSVRGRERRLLARATPAVPYGEIPPFIQVEVLPPRSP